jgi:hypothetical protein
MKSVNSKKKLITEESGTIRPGRWSAILTIIGGVVISTFSIYCYFEDSDLVFLWTFLIGALIAGFMAPSLSKHHEVSWNLQGIEGPSKTFGFTLGFWRTKIDWLDITGFDITGGGFWYIESKDGRRVYWSSLYLDYEFLFSALQRHCPNLELDDGFE